MSESMGLPGTSGGTSYVKPGMRRLTIQKIEPWLDKNGQPRADKRGYPGIEITFKDQTGAIISDGFYYSTAPYDDPSRTDDNLKCKSEVFLDGLKRALGFGRENVTAEKLKDKWVWAIVAEEQTIDVNGKILSRYSRLTKKFYPDSPNKPMVDGDPEFKANEGVPSGDFVTTKQSYKSVDKPAEDKVENTAYDDTPSDQPPSNDDMPVSEDDY